MAEYLQEQEDNRGGESKHQSNNTVLESHINFYKESLNLADQEVRLRVETYGTALKDVVGAAFENHRKRIWEYFSRLAGCEEL